MIHLLDLFTRAIAWLQIALSPIIIGLIAGSLVYSYRKDIYSLVLGIALATIGIVIGVVWATRAWKRRGTVEYMGKLLSMPELERDDEDRN